jgi:hypothetical protein
MARTPAEPSTALVNWDDIMAQEAVVAVTQEASTSTSSFFSLRGGILTFNDMAMPDNQMAVIILDSILENVYYDSDFNPDAISAPKCFAYGRDEASLKPHDVVFEHGQEENAKCEGCPRNEWGSAERGRGKACSNRRRLSLLAAGRMNGSFFPAEPAELATSAIGLLKLPVMSVKAFSGYIKQIGSVMKRPPFGVITLIKVVPDPKSQFRVEASFLGKTPDSLLPVVMQRREEGKAALEQPYSLDFDAEPPAKPGPARRQKY